MRLKKFILFVAVVLLISPLFSDIFVNLKNLNVDRNVNFVELIIVSGNSSTMVTVKFGQARNFLPGHGELTGPDGRKLLIVNGIDAVRFFERNGWKYISSYMQCQNGTKTEHFFFKRSR